jgi:hypothetical protein
MTLEERKPRYGKLYRRFESTSLRQQVSTAEKSCNIVREMRGSDICYTKRTRENPPFNCRINGHVLGNGSVHHREFLMAAGEMSEVEFTAFLATSLGLLGRYSASGSVHFVCMDWRHMRELLSAGKQVYDTLLNLCVWAKNNGGMGSFYRSQHELVFVFRNGKEQHRNNVQLGQYGRNRTNVWTYQG